MTVLLIGFLVTAALLWLSVFGYVLVLAAVAFKRANAGPRLSNFPEIAVVVPTLNEEDLIVSKLENLRQSDYPQDRMTVVVVDGGSSDQTTARVGAAMAGDLKIELMRVNDARGVADQVNHALGRVRQEIAVVSDADGVFEPACIRQLVRVLVNDPATAVVGALVQPRTALLEERIHWWLLNNLWWLEGEALSAAMVSGTCFALRRESVLPLCEDSRMHDVNLALVAAARGFRVRICRMARAWDVRAPQNAREFVRFRLRRGRYYVSELRRSSGERATPLGWRLAHGIRLWHFLASPVLAAMLAMAGGLLMWSPYWPWPFVTLAAFATPAGGALFVSTALGSATRSRWKLSLAACRLVGLTLFSLFALHRRPAPGRALASPSRAQGDAFS